MAKDKQPTESVGKSTGKSTRKSKGKSLPTARRTRYLALEPRIVFDGALGADLVEKAALSAAAGEMVVDTAAQAPESARTPAAEPAATPIAADSVTPAATPATPAGSTDSQKEASPAVQRDASQNVPDSTDRTRADRL